MPVDQTVTKTIIIKIKSLLLHFFRFSAHILTEAASAGQDFRDQRFWQTPEMKETRAR